MPTPTIDADVERAINYLANLPPGRVVARPECAVHIPGNHVMGVCRLYKAEEGAAGWHVAEVARRGAGRCPARRQHDYLAQLAARDIVAWAERAVYIARDQIVVVSGFNVWIVGIARLY